MLVMLLCQWIVIHILEITNWSSKDNPGLVTALVFTCPAPASSLTHSLDYGLSFQGNHKILCLSFRFIIEVHIASKTTSGNLRSRDAEQGAGITINEYPCQDLLSHMTLSMVTMLSRPQGSVVQRQQEHVRMISWILSQTNGFFCHFLVKTISLADVRWKV
ncbi:hypothetical protein HGM15179_013333 [Zosterops borbonicus]|uniref:Uncharacterized protein n=1 Tax=Zosterops borbonicus TaxID=364589 RepID=A0A8K1LH30_9PASS|nr:hypothetical protein HGM15179_013333 [Zosterops borbonicus]